MFLEWVSFACGNRWTGIEILKLCQRREEHQLIANVRFDTALQQDRLVGAQCRRTLQQLVHERIRLHANVCANAGVQTIGVTDGQAVVVA